MEETRSGGCDPVIFWRVRQQFEDGAVGVLGADLNAYLAGSDVFGSHYQEPLRRRFDDQCGTVAYDNYIGISMRIEAFSNDLHQRTGPPLFRRNFVDA